MSSFTIRPYRPGDERNWLECRLLSFFEGSYFDDVHTAKTAFDGDAIELVAVDGDGRVVGLMDVELDGEAATIDVVAVRPDAQRAGVASALLVRAREVLPSGVTTLDAWTREDPSANAWYLRSGFDIRYRYLHVYISEGDPMDGFATPDGLSLPVTAFLHAPLNRADEFRARYRRTYECRRYVLPLTPPLAASPSGGSS